MRTDFGVWQVGFGVGRDGFWELFFGCGVRQVGLWVDGLGHWPWGVVLGHGGLGLGIGGGGWVCADRFWGLRANFGVGMGFGVFWGFGVRQVGFVG